MDRFKLLTMGIHVQKLHGKTIVWSLQNYSLYIDSASSCQYKKWQPIIVCVRIFTRMDKVTMINHIVSTRVEKNI